MIEHEHRSLDPEQEERINKIQFSNLANLYYEAITQDEVIYYRLKVQKDLTSDQSRKQELKQQKIAQQLIDESRVT